MEKCKFQIPHKLKSISSDYIYHNIEKGKPCWNKIRALIRPWNYISAKHLIQINS
jgi:hypothetical protein